MKTKRGQKICKSCNKINGVRAYECKECGAEFEMKKKRKGGRKKQISDHTVLNKGDIIKVVGNSGPYYIGSDGDKHYFTDRGKYTVMSVYKDGIQACGPHGYTYLYMGTPRQSPLVESVQDAPHKIVLLQDCTSRTTVSSKARRARS